MILTTVIRQTGWLASSFCWVALAIALYCLSDINVVYAHALFCVLLSTLLQFHVVRLVLRFWRLLFGLMVVHGEKSASAALSQGLELKCFSYLYTVLGVAVFLHGVHTLIEVCLYQSFKDNGACKCS